MSRLKSTRSAGASAAPASVAATAARAMAATAAAGMRRRGLDRGWAKVLPAFAIDKFTLHLRAGRITGCFSGRVGP